nr:hypothetical protein [Tanacetum cinerariifolium]
MEAVFDGVIDDSSDFAPTMEFLEFGIVINEMAVEGSGWWIGGDGWRRTVAIETTTGFWGISGWRRMTMDIPDCDWIRMETTVHICYVRCREAKE